MKIEDCFWDFRTSKVYACARPHLYFGTRYTWISLILYILCLLALFPYMYGCSLVRVLAVKRLKENQLKIISSYLVSEGGFQYILDLPSSHHQDDITFFNRESRKFETVILGWGGEDPKIYYVYLIQRRKRYLMISPKVLDNGK